METWPPISIICNTSIFLNTKAILVSWSKLWKKIVLIQINFNIVVYIVCRESVFTIPFFISESEIVSYNVWWFPFHLLFYQSVPLGLNITALLHVFLQLQDNYPLFKSSIQEDLFEMLCNYRSFLYTCTMSSKWICLILNLLLVVVHFVAHCLNVWCFRFQSPLTLTCQMMRSWVSNLTCTPWSCPVSSPMTQTMLQQQMRSLAK